MDAVAGDHDAATHRGAVTASRPIGKAQRDAGPVLLDGCAMMVVSRRSWPARARNASSSTHLQIAAMDRDCG